jgi:histidinol-phosphate aminotransferase
MYGVLANLNAVENREVLLTEDFQPEIEKIMEAVDTKMIFYVRQPNWKFVFR